MAKKVKLGTIKVTSKVTVTRRIEAKQSINQNYSYEQVISPTADMES